MFFLIQTDIEITIKVVFFPSTNYRGRTSGRVPSRAPQPSSYRNFSFQRGSFNSFKGRGQHQHQYQRRPIMAAARARQQGYTPTNERRARSPQYRLSRSPINKDQGETLNFPTYRDQGVTARNGEKLRA